jgi:hypothetical protein
MSNYVKATNFATKDTLPTGDANKIVKGTEIDNEFNAIAGAVSSKADLASPTFTGTPAAPTAIAGTNTTQLATTAFVTAALQAVYPVGSIYINATSSSNPSTLLGFGTWEAFGAGRMIVGLNASDALFDTVEETGGSKDAIAVSHTHTATSSSIVDTRLTSAGNYDRPSAQAGGRVSIPADGISAKFYTSGGGSDFYHWGIDLENRPTTQTVTTTVASAGSSGTNANLPPYIVARMWKRTA